MAQSAFRIGIVGVGRMGANMARRLHDLKYHIVAVYDTKASRAETLSKEVGCIAAATPAEVAELANTVLTVVPDDAAMRHIYAPSKPDSLLRHAANRLFINCAPFLPLSKQKSTTWWRKRAAAASRPVWRAAFPRRVKARCISCAADDGRYSSAQPRYSRT